MKEILLEGEIVKNILLNNLKREKNTLIKFACYSNSAIRFHGEAIKDKCNIRPSFFHDTDKIIHSSAYTRYIDKTQVFYLFENDHITHRVLHVQLVSKISRVIGRALKLNEDLLEAIALGHDLGHVPYGHEGERKLSKLTQKYTGEYFCHNAQSVRLLMNVENYGKGLNISLQVLDGILCHNGEMLLDEYVPNYKKTASEFLDEYKKCWTVENFSKKIIPMTLEGCVVRISDIIAYLGRDFEDAIVLGLIKRSDIPLDIVEILGDNNSSLINNIVLDLINNSYGKNYLKLSPDIFKAIQELYAFSVTNIYNNLKKSYQDYKIENMFDYLYDYFLSDLNARNSTSSIINDFTSFMDEEYMQITKPERIVCDYLAGMTDDYFNNQYKSLVIPQSFGMSLK